MTTRELTNQAAERMGNCIKAHVKGLITRDETITNFSYIMDELIAGIPNDSNASDISEVLDTVNTIRVISESMQGIRRR